MDGLFQSQLSTLYPKKHYTFRSIKLSYVLEAFAQLLRSQKMHTFKNTTFSLQQLHCGSHMPRIIRTVSAGWRFLSSFLFLFLFLFPDETPSSDMHHMAAKIARL
jgi:hypothetical protein